MSMRRRVAAVEQAMQVNTDVRVPIVLGFGNDDHWRERAEEARRHGWGLNVIRFGLCQVAETVEEADAIVAQHREEEGACPVTVYLKGTRNDEVLVEWDPGLPEWLRNDEEEDRELTDSE